MGLDVDLVRERDKRRLRSHPGHEVAEHHQPQVAAFAQRRYIGRQQPEAAT